MPWKPLPRIAVAVATYPFTASSPQDLPLEIGDDLYIIEHGGKDGSWYRGYLVAPPSLLSGLTSGKGQTLEARVFSGIFPRCCVDVREHLGEPGSEGDGHSPLINGDSPKVNGNTPKRQNSLLQRASSRRRDPDSSSSVKDRILNRDTDKDSNPSKSAVRSPSQHKADLSTSPTLARKLSHRSISNAQFRNSPDPSAPIIDVPRDPAAKRPQAPVPMLKIGDETPTSTSEPLVDEIASCLREWHSKNLHELLLARRYKVLDKISVLVKRLDVARRQLLHGVLTAQELSSLREEIVWDLVRGNKLLSNEVIVRDPSQNGRLLVGDDSPFEVSKLQSTMSLMDRPPLFTHDLLNLYHLFAEVKGFAAQSLPSPSLTLYLCARQHGCQPRRVTENFAIDLSPPDVFEASSGQAKLRTLFAELAANDIADVSGPASDIYLVIQVEASQQVQSTSRTPQSPGRINENTKPRPLTGNAGTPSPKGGRQSLMWAQKQFGSVRSRSQAGMKPVQESPAETSETSDETSRPDTGESIRPVTQQGPQYVKRNVGIGVVNLRMTFKHPSVSEQRIPIWAAATASSEGMEQSDGAWDEILRDLISSKRNKYTKAPGIDHVRLSLQSFVHPEVDGLIADTPTLLSNITVTQKMDFTGAPLRPRSDIYVTLTEASLPHQALFSHPERGVVPLAANAEMRNIQLTMEVRKRSGERIENCIFPSSDSEALRAWRTRAVERGEPWNQTIKLNIPDEDVPGAHLIMSVAEAPGFPFALGWIPLMQEDTFIKDGNHAPLLYLYDKITSSSEKGRGVYMDFPWSSRSQNNDEKDEALTGPIATVKLETKLCSTTFSQDKTLLAILDWRQSPSKAQTLGYVKRFSFVPEIDVVKMIGDVLDALFSILIGSAEVEENEDLVFDALVVALSIVYDRRFNLEPYLDKYAETQFDHAYAAPCLIRAFTRLVADHSKQRNSRRVRAAFKVGRHILKFIIRAREKLQVKEAGIGTTTQSSFKRDLKGIFNSFEELIRNPAPALIGDRTLVVQHMPAWLPELKTVFSEEELLQLASNIVDACEDVHGKLILYKLLLILKLTDISLLSQDHVRSRIVANTARWIAPYWGFSEDVSQQWREQTRLCCSIVASHAHQPGFDGVKYLDKVIESYCAVKASNSISNSGTLSLLFPIAYPFPAKPTTAVSKYDECLIELSSILAHLSATPFDHITDLSMSETANMVSNVLDIVSSVLSGQAFPKSWLSLFVYHHKSMLQTLESMFDIMAAKMVPSPEDAEQFNTDLWNKYLSTLLLLIRSDVLALETFPEQKRRVVWKIAGDVREQGSILLRRSWEAIGWDTSAEEQKRYGLTRLGGFQVQYVPGLVASTVELCLSVHEGLRRVAIKILQAMIISEWTLNDDLSMVQTEVIDSLDNLYKTKEIGNTLVQKMFINELVDAFEYLARMPLDPLWQTIQDTVSTIDELLDMLVAVHGQDLDESLRVTDTLQLMNFYKDLQKEHIFIRYVHQLADVQKQMNNYTEAGLALQLHADQYSWGSTPVRALDEPKYPEQSSFERKEHLYFEMITCFEEGAAWECALAAYRELANQYELVHFDFPKLARTQRAMATIYETVGKGEWQPPRYFRVIYRGLGFQENLQNREFIYQGEPSERLSAFTDRMRQLHPSAQILSKGEPEDMEGQYLQILPVSVYRDLQHPIYQQPKVAQSTRDYITSARPQRFAVTSKRHSPASMVQDQWIEKTVYTTQEPLPTILRRSEIVSVNTIRLSPLQTAVERTSRKTAELASFERRVLNGDDTGFSNLTEGIISSVDPTSVATVAQYRGLVPRKADEEDQEDEDFPDPELSPMENALQIALLDHVSMIKHCLTHYSSPTHLGTQSSLTDSLNHTFAPEMALLQTTPPALEAPQPEFQDPLASPPSSMGFSSTSLGKPSFSLTNGHSVTTSSAPPPIPEVVPPRTTVPPNNSKSRLSFGMLKSPSFGSTNSTKQQQQAQPNGSISAPSDQSSSRNNSNNTTTVPPIFHPTTVRKEVNGVGYDTSNGSLDRPVTSQSSKSSSTSNVAGTGRMKKRLSSLGLGRVGSRLDKVRGLNGSMGAVGEEE